MEQNVDLDVQARGKRERQRYREWKEGHGQPKGVRLKWIVPASNRARPLKAENPKDVTGMKQAQQIQQDGAKRAKKPAVLAVSTRASDRALTQVNWDSLVKTDCCVQTSKGKRTAKWDVGAGAGD